MASPVLIPDARETRVTRVVTLPIREVGGGEPGRVLDTFRPCWRLATDLANWAQLELACRDVRREPGMERYPAYDRAAMFGTNPRRFGRAAKGDKPAAAVGDPQVSSLYDLWTREYPDRAAWDGASVSARDVLTAVEKTWTRHKEFGRFAVMWQGKARPAVFRFPYPWPTPADKGKTLRLSRDEAGRPLASFPLPGGGRTTVRLADGREFRRQLRQLDVLFADPSRLRQAKITGRYLGSKLVGADIRLVADFDAAPAVQSGTTATVSTGGDCVLRAVVEGDDGNPFVIHADQLRGVIHAYDRWRYRLARDMKHEKRWPTAKRRRTTDGMTVQSRVAKMAGRIDAERKQMAACVVGWLVRRGVADVAYDDRESGYFDWADDRGEVHRRFDMTALRAAVSCKCEEAGISFQHVAGADDASE